MTTTSHDWLAYVDAMTELQRLPLSRERCADVARQLVQIEILAQQFVEFPLEPEVEPASVFRP